MPSRPHKEQSGKVSSKVGTARRPKMRKRRRRTGKKKDQMEMHWAEDEKLEEILERRRAEGVSLQAEVLQKVPGVHARGTKEKKDKLKDGLLKR